MYELLLNFKPVKENYERIYAAIGGFVFKDWNSLEALY